MHDEGQAKGASGSAPLDYGEEATLTLKTKPDQKKKKRETPAQGWGGAQSSRSSYFSPCLSAARAPTPAPRGPPAPHART